MLRLSPPHVVRPLHTRALLIRHGSPLWLGERDVHGGVYGAEYVAHGHAVLVVRGNVPVFGGEETAFDVEGADGGRGGRLGREPAVRFMAGGGRRGVRWDELGCGGRRVAQVPYQIARV